MVIWNNMRTDMVRLTRHSNGMRYDNNIKQKVCNTPGGADVYARKVRESGRKAWTVNCICYYV